MTRKFALTIVAALLLSAVSAGIGAHYVTRATGTRLCADNGIADALDVVNHGTTEEMHATAASLRSDSYRIVTDSALREDISGLAAAIDSKATAVEAGSRSRTRAAVLEKSRLSKHLHLTCEDYRPADWRSVADEKDSGN